MIAVRRLIGGLLDQASAAALSFLVLAISAKELDAASFGLFAMLNGTYIFAQSIEQALVSEALVVGQSAGARSHRALLAQLAVQGTEICAGLSLLAGFVALLLSGSALITCAFALATLVGLSSDVFRGSLIASGHASGVAATSVLGLIASLALFLTTNELSVAIALGYWGAAFAPLAVIGSVVTLRHWHPFAGHRVESARSSPRGLRSTLMIEALVGAGAAYLVLLLVDIFAGREDAGSFRLAIALVGPVSVLFNVIRLYGVAELTRNMRTGRQKRLAIRISSGAAAMTMLYWSALFAVPTKVAESLLGPAAWQGAAPLLVWAAIHRAAIGASLGPGVVLRSAHAFWGPTIVRVACAVIVAVLSIGLIPALGPEGAFIALASGALTQTLVLLARFDRWGSPGGLATNV